MLQTGWFLLAVATVMGALETLESLQSPSTVLVVCLLVSGAALTVAGAIVRLGEDGPGPRGASGGAPVGATHDHSDPAAR